MIPYLFNKFQRSKREDLSNMAAIETTEEYGNFYQFLTCYHSLNVLPQALLWNFPEICLVLVWGISFSQFFSRKNINLYLFGKLFQIVRKLC